MNPLLEAWQKAWQPHDRRPIHEWARDPDNVMLPNAYAVTGAFHVEKSPYLIEVFNANLDDTVRVSTVQKGVQSAGSLSLDLTIVHTIKNRPQHIFWNFPTDEAAEAYARRRAMPLLYSCPATARLIQGVRESKRHDVRKTEIMFPNMWIAIQGANETNLQTQSVPIVANDELWEWRPAMYQHACARVSYFQWRSKIINVSQAGDLGSDMDQAFKAGTQEEWEVPCLHCNKYQPLHWSYRLPEVDAKGRPIFAGICWETNDTTKPGGVWNFDAMKATVRYRCPFCLEYMDDRPDVRRKLNDLGRYRVMNPNAPKDNRSFHWPSWVCDQVSWAKVAEEYLRAKDQEKIGNRVLIREWWLKRAAVSYDPHKHTTYELAPAIELRSPESPTPGPSGRAKKFWELQDFIWLLVDVQRDHMWALADAWSKTGQNMYLDFRRLLTWEDIEDFQAEYGIADRCVFVDARHRTHEVYKQCTLHGHVVGPEWRCWTAVMGDGRRSFRCKIPMGYGKFTHVNLPYKYPPDFQDPCLNLRAGDPDLARIKGKRCPLIYFAKGTLDQMSFDRRDLLMRGEVSYMAKGKWNNEFCKQLHGEQPEVTISPLGVQIWKSRVVGPNHGLDLMRIGLMAACIAEIINAKT